MQTPIGKTLESGGVVSWLAFAAGIGLVGVDLVLSAKGLFGDWRDYGPAVGALAVSGGIALGRHDGASFGFRFAPIQGWWYWAKATVWIGVGMLALILTTWSVVVAVLHYPIPQQHIYLTGADQIWPHFVWMCIRAPLVEEPVSRLAICPPLTARFGPATAIVVSGVAFGLAHVLHGNPGPDNLVAGFILAWAYLKSGTIVVPITLHALGNLCAFAFQVVYFYLYRA